MRKVRRQLLLLRDTEPACHDKVFTRQEFSFIRVRVTVLNVLILFLVMETFSTSAKQRFVFYV